MVIFSKGYVYDYEKTKKYFSIQYGKINSGEKTILCKALIYAKKMR